MDYRYLCVINHLHGLHLLHPVTKHNSLHSRSHAFLSVLVQTACAFQCPSGATAKAIASTTKTSKVVSTEVAGKISPCVIAQGNASARNSSATASQIVKTDRMRIAVSLQIAMKGLASKLVRLTV